MARISMISLGCVKNTVDAEMALASLLGADHELALDPADAEVIIVNTCGFIQSARDEAEETIRECIGIKAASGGGVRLAVMGCLAERSPGEMLSRFPEIDAVWGLAIQPDIVGALARLLEARGRGDPVGLGKPERPHEGPRLLSTPSSYAYLKISDGCDNRCAYCAIPDIRGGFRSRPPSALLGEAKVLEDQGVRELVVISQDTTLYGKDLKGAGGLADLAEALLKETRFRRMRFLYAHPAHLDGRMAGLLETEPRLCHYIDLPFQHVSSRVLAAMGRGYGLDRVWELAARFGGDDFTLRTTLLTGFPGEAEEDFLEALRLVESGKIKHLGVFSYSPEEGTPAARFEGRVEPSEADRRRDALLAAQQAVAFAWLDSRVGGTEELLVDRAAGGGWLEARSVREAPDADGLVFLGDSAARSGDFVKACIVAREGYDLTARPVKAAGKRDKRRAGKGGGGRRGGGRR